MAITPNKQKRQKVLDLLGAFAYLENITCNLPKKHF